MSTPHPARRRWLVPEVVQTSAMDCGPAVLKALLEGFGIPIRYDRLREACQTDVDGTSIDTLEAVAGQLGLAADQIMIPVDHLPLAEARALPAVLVVRLPNGLTHFVLAWRKLGPVVQVMDPAVGRRWVSCARLEEEVYLHTQRVPAGLWREWAGSEEFLRPLAARLASLGIGQGGQALIREATADPDWRALARLDAATRLVAALVRAGGLKRGSETRRTLRSLVNPGQSEGQHSAGTIPENFWSVQPAPPVPDDEGEHLLLRGAVLVRASGLRPPGAAGNEAGCAGPAEVLSPELAAALAHPTVPAGRALLGLLGGESLPGTLVLAIGLVLAAGGVVFEALLLRSTIDIGRSLQLTEQRILAVGVFLVFIAVLLLIELGVARGLARLGRRLELGLRVRFLEAIPRLHDRYFQSRPTSDMAERVQSLHQVRLFPRQAGQFLRAAIALGITAAAVTVSDPASGPLAIGAAILALALPLLPLPLLQGLDLRVRTHAGALSRFYLDALQGLTAARAHAGAGRALRREHEGLLVEWARASQRLLHWVVAIEGLQSFVGFGLAGWLLFRHAGRETEPAGALLLAYWTLNLPVLGAELAMLARQHPIHRNLVLRLLEPLGAPECDPGEDPPATREIAARMSPSSGVAITFESVTVSAAGQTILEAVEARVAAGDHVAIVGPSGAGKSSLVGLLLGWHRAAAGRVVVDGEPLTAARLDRLRGETAWIDPEVRLWNRPLIGNLLYGTHPPDPSALGDVLHEADLLGVLRHLPDGLQTSLGEGGGRLSGGEGQRVRLARALLRPGVRLVILDEPFRGLDRAQRVKQLRRARQYWRDATLLCITHDIAETRDFDCVLVIEAGRLVEQGPPDELASDPGSRYRALLDVEDSVRSALWSSPRWQRLRLQAGRLQGKARENGCDQHAR
jgi:ABC-type bacteriocin/lantibiotic exporter with double-glycine peptidase domain